MKRVLRPGGVMAFSSHNTNFLPVVVDNYRFRVPGRVLRETARSLKWTMVFNFHNPTCAFVFLRRRHGQGWAACLPVVGHLLHQARSAGRRTRPPRHDGIRCAMNDNPHFLDSKDPQVATFASPWVYYRCRKPRQAA